MDIRRLTLFSLCGFTALGFYFAAPVMAAEDNYLMVTVANPQQDEKSLSAKVAINAPPAIVWESITDYRNLKNVLPGYEKSTVLKDNGRNKTLAVATKVARFLPTYEYEVKVLEDQTNQKIQLDRISGDLKSMHAVYRLIPQEGGKKTLLVYDLNIDPGTKIPGSHLILKNYTEKSLAALEQYVESQYRKSLVGQHSR